jgi:DNA (cytosine-5)-methyltransferase 1
MNELRVAHLFAGIGGGILAAEILGHRSVLAIEQNPDRCHLLRERAADGWFPGLEVWCGDIRAFDWTPWKGRVDCIAAGFPCQDISCAGSGAGIAGERSGLVWEVFRAADAIRPRYVFLENSPNIRTRGRREIVAALVARGYAWRDGEIAAAAVGALHKRRRWFLLADTDIKRRGANHTAGNHDNGNGAGRAEEDGLTEACPETVADAAGNRMGQEGAEQPRREGKSETEFPVADALIERLQGASGRGEISGGDCQAIIAASAFCDQWTWNPVDLGVCGMVHGLSAKFHGVRISALGDAQVPLQAAAAWECLSR